MGTSNVVTGGMGNMATGGMDIMGLSISAPPTATVLS